MAWAAAMEAVGPAPPLEQLSPLHLARAWPSAAERQLTGLLQHVRRIAAGSASEAEAWRRISKQLLPPGGPPFATQLLLFNSLFARWSAQRLGPAPAWLPSREGAEATNLGRFMRTWDAADWQRVRTGCDADDVCELQRISVARPEEFWATVLKELRICFCAAPRCMVEHATGERAGEGDVWLPGARLNIADSCFVGRDPDAPAVVWAEEGDPTAIRTWSLEQLRRRAAAVSRALAARGLGPGARVAVVAPMTADAVAVFLGIVLAGCAVVGIPDSFAASEIAARVRISRSALVVTAAGAHRAGRFLALYPRVAEAVAQVPEGVAVVVMDASSGSAAGLPLARGHLAYDEFLRSGGDADGTPARGVEMAAESLSSVYFSSGTTGEPKAIPWTHVTPLRAAINGWAHQDIRARDVVAWPTNLGWMMGPWLVYAALVNNASIALFHGSPLGGPFCRFVQAARVTMLGVIPSMVKAWRAGDCTQGLDWSSIRCFSSTGEASNPTDVLWLMSRADWKPVMEYCGGTEIGGAFLSGTLVQPQAPSHFSLPAMGVDLRILGPAGRLLRADEAGTGEIALAPPLLGSSQRLLHGDHERSYFQGMPRLPDGRRLRRHGDEIERTCNGYFLAHGRVDDTMNLGGIKVSSIELERICASAHPSVAEVAAVSLPPPGGGPEQLVCLAVLHGGCDASPTLLAEVRDSLQAVIRRRLNPLFRVDGVVAVQQLPRTASNKVMRRELRAALLAARQRAAGAALPSKL